ncbi:hypothetical protein ZIOFF_060989 [Zingiber officinale]|uniref:Uncharacterized protein n=1 Tax=Zingiber officinale TaxID=94328 RepID=A0A8J5FQ58_ZINOF|nr:hypothetical protein ZIOFF_060989 [Zingiber officinale]
MFATKRFRDSSSLIPVPSLLRRDSLDAAPTLSSSQRTRFRDSSSLIPAPSLLRRDSPDAAPNAPSLPSFWRGDSSLLPAPVIACYCRGFVFFLLSVLYISSFHEIVFDLIQKYILDMKHLGSSGFAEGVHIMPPKRIEHLPVLETPIDDSSSRGQPIRRETRGTHSDRLRRQISDRGRLSVTFRQSDGHPIGPNVTSFMIELGLLVKKFVPLQAKTWKHIPAENKRMIYDRISVLDTRSRYIRGFESGSKPVRSTSSDATSSSRSTNAALRERLESTQDELANTKIQLANTQDELASIKLRQNMFEQILNRLAPGALDSLIHDSSSTPPPPPPPPPLLS